MQTSEASGLLDKAFEKRSLGSYAGALDDFMALEKLATQSEELSALRLYQTYCLLDMGKAHEALQRITLVCKGDLEESLQAVYEYHFSRILHSLGNVKEALGHLENARKMFVSLGAERFDKYIVTNAETLFGLLLAESERCSEALPLLQRVTIDDYDWGYAKLRIGDCYMATEHFDEAIEAYATIISSDLKVSSAVKTDAIRNIGCCYYWLGIYDKSVIYLTQVADSYDEFPDLKERVISFLSSASSHLRRKE